MKRWFTIIAATALLAGCATSSSDNASSGPSLDLHLAQVSSSSNVFYFRGPLNVRYQLLVNNPGSETYRLRAIDLRSIAGGAYSIRTGSTPIKQTIKPNGATTIELSAWANAHGGYLTADEPVSVRGIAYFEDGTGRRFQKIFTETLTQFGGS